MGGGGVTIQHATIEKKRKQYKFEKKKWERGRVPQMKESNKKFKV